MPVLELHDNVLVASHTVLARIPKEKCSESAQLQQYGKGFKDIFSSDGKIVYCQLCGKSIKVNQQLQIMQCLSGNKYIASASCSSSKQVLLGETGLSLSLHSGPTKYCDFYSDLYRRCV